MVLQTWLYRILLLSQLILDHWNPIKSTLSWDKFIVQEFSQNRIIIQQNIISIWVSLIPMHLNFEVSLILILLIDSSIEVENKFLEQDKKSNQPFTSHYRYDTIYLYKPPGGWISMGNQISQWSWDATSSHQWLCPAIANPLLVSACVRQHPTAPRSKTVEHMWVAKWRWYIAFRGIGDPPPGEDCRWLDRAFSELSRTIFFIPKLSALKKL